MLYHIFQTIECYIRAVLNAKGANLYQLSHYTTAVILNGTKDQIIRQGLKKVSATTCDSAFLFVHVFMNMFIYISDIQVNFEHYDGVISVVNVTGMCWRFVVRKKIL